MSLEPVITPETEKSHQRCFHAHETERLRQLDGTPLATFGQRLLGFAVDLLLAILLWAPLELAWQMFVLHEQELHAHWDFHEAGNIVAAAVYFGLCNYFGNGQTPGKRLARTRAVSLTGERIGPWQAVERGLGYGAAVLEGGLGFLQYFWSENRMCAQDRLADTIVIDLRKPRS
jgi:uncharacterized RDD family membrane protein YckC